MLDTTSTASQPSEKAAPPARRRRRRRPSLRTALVVTHRWLALLLGLALLAVVISGVVLLYEQEIDRVVHPALHRGDRRPRTRSPTPRRSPSSAARRPTSSRPTSSTATAST